MPAAVDKYAAYQGALGGPAATAFPITPDNSNDLAFVCLALVIGTGGALKVTTFGGDTVTLTAVPAGVLPLRVSRVWATGTTATGISGLT